MEEFYGTIEEADAYHAARASDAWAAESSEEAKEAALIRASIYIDGRYRDRFSGYKTSGRSQYLQWPRTDATDAEGEDIESDEIPVEILNATYEAALRELTDPGSLSPDVTGTSRVIREKVGELETQYAEASQIEDARPTLTVIDDILAGLLGTDTGTVTFLQRA